MDCDRNSVMTLPVIQYPLSWSNPSKIEPFTPAMRNNRNAEEDEREFGEWPVKIVSYTPVVQGPNRTNQPSVQSLTHAEFAVRPNGPYHIPVLAARYPKFAGNNRTLVPANVSKFHAISRQQNMPVHQQRATGPPFPKKREPFRQDPNMCYGPQENVSFAIHERCACSAGTALFAASPAPIPTVNLQQQQCECSTASTAM